MLHSQTVNVVCLANKHNIGRRFVCWNNDIFIIEISKFSSDIRNADLHRVDIVALKIDVCLFIKDAIDLTYSDSVSTSISSSLAQRRA